jgi:hypothetical protein
MAGGADERLRNAPGKLDAARRPQLLQLSRPGGTAGSLPRRAGLYPRRIHAVDGAPARRVLGLPDAPVSSRRVRASAAPTTCVPSIEPAPGRNRRHPRLGARAFSADDWALANYDGTALYEHEDPRLGLHADWGTHIFNYGRHEVRSFLLSSACTGGSEFHFDGAARRCRRLDALPRLFAQGRRMAAQRTAAAKTSTPSPSSRSSTKWCMASFPAR